MCIAPCGQSYGQEHYLEAARGKAPGSTKALGSGLSGNAISGKAPCSYRFVQAKHNEAPSHVHSFNTELG